MATWVPINGLAIQLAKNAGGAAAADYYLKFYNEGTTTPASMATDSTGGTTLDKCKLDANGLAVNGSDDPFIPHIDRNYKLVCYTNATDADNNATGSAFFVIDNIKFSSGDAGGINYSPEGTNPTTVSIATYLDKRVLDDVTALRAYEPVVDEEQVFILGHTELGKGGGNVYHDASDTTTADNGVTVFVTSSGARWKRPLDAPITPRSAGAIGDGVSTDTTQVQAAVDAVIAYGGTLQGVPGDNYKIGNITLTNPTNTNFYFNGATFTLTGTAAGNGLGFQVVGDATGMKFKHAKIVGDGVVANKHKGVWSDSGQTWKDVEIEYNDISGVINGISLNSNLSGSVVGCKVRFNKISNVVGVNTGEGYGIQWAYPGASEDAVECAFNEIDGAQRHSIYCAAGGHSTIFKNTIKNHRQGVAAAVGRYAINVLRGSNVRVANNWIEDGYDGYINISGSLDTGVAAKDIECCYNTLINRQNAVEYIKVGEATATPTETSNINVHHNTISQDFSVFAGGIGVVIDNGINVRFDDNTLKYKNATSGTQIFVKWGSTLYSSDSYFTDSGARRNKFYIDGGAGARAFSVQSAPATNTSDHDIFDNELFGLSEYINFAATQTNPNLKHDQWTNIVFNDFWANNSSAEPVRAKLTSGGMVLLKGRTAPNGSTSTTVGTVPVHCEPGPSGTRNALTSARDNGGHTGVQINTTSRALIVDSVAVVWVTFEGVSYALSNSVF